MVAIADVLRDHGIVGLDITTFIYYLEGSTPFAAPASAVFAELERGTFEGVTSVLTIMELTVKPLQVGRQDIARRYEVLLSNFPNLQLVPVDRAIARRAARLRAEYRVRPADALQIAACLQHGATAFVTNDRDLRRVIDLQVILLDDFILP